MERTRIRRISARPLGLQGDPVLGLTCTVHRSPIPSGSIRAGSLDRDVFSRPTRLAVTIASCTRWTPDRSGMFAPHRSFFWERSVADVDPDAVALEYREGLQGTPDGPSEPEPARLGGDHHIAPGHADVERSDLIAQGGADLSLDPPPSDDVGILGALGAGIALRPGLVVGPGFVARRGQRSRRRPEESAEEAGRPARRGTGTDRVRVGPGGGGGPIAQVSPIHRAGRRGTTRGRSCALRLVVERLDGQRDGLTGRVCRRTGPRDHGTGRGPPERGEFRTRRQVIER